MPSGQVTQIGADIFQIKIPLPTPALRSVNSYVIRTPERSLIIDTGFDRQECLEALESGLKKLGLGFENADFFLTHAHGDHMGLVSRVATPKNKLYMNAIEIGVLRFFSNLDTVSAYMIQNGFPADVIQAAVSRFPKDRSELEKRARLPYEKVVDGADLNIGDKRFVFIHTPGHTPGHTCLYAPQEKLLFCGDHILKNISPTIQCVSDATNPVATYLKSLEKVRRLDIDVLLPGHRGIIEDPQARIDELIKHHEERFEEILRILDSRPKSAYQVAQKMKWDLPYPTWSRIPDDQKWFATSEAISHLRYLEEAGRVGREAGGAPVKFDLI